MDFKKIVVIYFSGLNFFYIYSQIWYKILKWSFNFSAIWKNNHLLSVPFGKLCRVGFVWMFALEYLVLLFHKRCVPKSKWKKVTLNKPIDWWWQSQQRWRLWGKKAISIHSTHRGGFSILASNFEQRTLVALEEKEKKNTWNCQFFITILQERIF